MYGGDGHDGLDMGGIPMGTWQEDVRVADDGFPITAMDFDVLEELLWVSIFMMAMHALIPGWINNTTTTTI